ncbi:hypothetical protein [Haloquadratum walsbyi]|uniref:Uncharacterized protein n=1 Tax=Haloquadratum walsbyi J07HQW2 TaxID=1238425 RepID=U1PLT4_9EURY|nr:hypothetical protein [Haloquadratum walsbyi]ERG94672.1 MAG: hypothetical protein J07HQW2_01109 [Haloquadratum walsbyi J07HQW2]
MFILEMTGEPLPIAETGSEQAQSYAVSNVAWCRYASSDGDGSKGIPELFSAPISYTDVSAHWLRPHCSRMPDNCGFNCECPPRLETGSVLRGSQLTIDGQSST